MSQIYTWPSQSVTATNPSVGINNTTIPASSTQVAGKSPTNVLRPLSVDETGELQVNVTDSVLPTGAATEATLLQVDADIVAGNAILKSIDAQAALLATEATLLTVKSDTAAIAASVASIDGKLANPMPVTGPLTDAQLRASAVPVSAASLPLPTGAATEAKQDTGNASLASIDSKLTAPLAVTGPLTDTQLRASAVPVSLASAPAAVGRTVIATVRNDYGSTPVTTGAWVQLIASTASIINMIELFDSSGQTLELGLGAPASESRLILVFPGGNGQVPVTIPSGSRLSVRAVSATANAGELDLNAYS